MKNSTLLLIAAGVGVYFLHKKKTQAAALAAAAPRIAALPEPGGSATAAPEVITGPEATEIYERVPDYGIVINNWAPSWGSYRGGRRYRGGPRQFHHRGGGRRSR